MCLAILFMTFLGFEGVRSFFNSAKVRVLHLEEKKHQSESLSNILCALDVDGREMAFVTLFFVLHVRSIL